MSTLVAAFFLGACVMGILACLVISIALWLHQRSIRKLTEQFEMVHSDEHFITRVYPPEYWGRAAE